MNKSFFSRYVIIPIILITIASIIFYLKTSGTLNLEQTKNYISQSGIYSPLIFTIFYIAIALTGISTIALSMLAGMLFEIKKAILIVIIASTIAATIAFYTTRTIFKNPSRIKNKTLTSITKKINNISEKHAFSTILILRLSYIPYIPLSYAAGLVKKLKYTPFISATILTNIFSGIIFILLGASILESLPIFISAILIIIIFLIIRKLLKTKYI